jgi:hypothetical protein
MHIIKTTKYMKYINKFKITKNYLRKLAVAISVAFAIVVNAPFAAHAASGDAYFSLSPSSGSYTIGNNLVLTISETSTSGDNVNAAQANLSYPSSLLQFQSISLTGPFTLCGQQTGGSGSVNIGCASTTVVSGTHPIAQVTFSVLASGSAPVAITSGSDIDNDSGVTVWNGVSPSASLTLSQTATAPTKPTTPSSGSSGSTKSSGSSSGSSGTGATTTTQTPTTAPTTASPSLASISVTIVSPGGKPIAGAKVTLNKQQSAVTNASGVASFSGVNSGAYTVTVSDPGRKSAETEFSLTAGQNKLVSFKLASTVTAHNYTDLVYIGIIIVILLLAGGIWSGLHRRKLNAVSMSTDQAIGSVVSGSANDVNSLPTANSTLPQIVAPAALNADSGSPLPPATSPETSFPSSESPKIVSPQSVVTSAPTDGPDPTIIRPTQTPGAE